MSDVGPVSMVTEFQREINLMEKFTWLTVSELSVHGYKASSASGPAVNQSIMGKQVTKLLSLPGGEQGGRAIMQERKGAEKHTLESLPQHLCL